MFCREIFLAAECSAHTIILEGEKKKKKEEEVSFDTWIIFENYC